MRRPIRWSALAAALLGLACAAPRSATGPATSGSAAKAVEEAEAKDRLICRYERPTGSNIAQRVCYTQEQLDEKSRAAQDELRRSTSNVPQKERG